MRLIDVAFVVSHFSAAAGASKTPVNALKKSKETSIQKKIITCRERESSAMATAKMKA